jgi:hypothetical protein
VGLATRVPSPYVHEGLLLLIAVVLAAACLVGALLLVRHAPAVGVALAVAAVAGVVAFFVSAAHDRHGVPQDVGVWASLGLWAGGAIGLVGTRGRPPSRPLRHAAVTSLVLAPFGAALLLLAVQQACPLYVMRGAGYCYYDVDLMGAWAGGVTMLFLMDMAAIVALLLISGTQAKKEEAILAEEWARF